VSFLTPDQLKLSVDVITIVVGIFAIYFAKKSAVGGTFGTGMNLILAGVFVLMINHLLDTVFLANFLKMQGHTTDAFQGPIVHRFINLFGFVLMAFGFATFSKQA
jgi:hypothetical protein